MWTVVRLALFLVLAAIASAAEPSALDENGLRQLLVIKRVYVDRITGGETAAQMREILISALEATKLFIVTENPDKADATMRGASEDLVFTEMHSSSESIGGHLNAGSSRSTRERGAYSGIGINESESTRSNERHHEAVAAVRLVNKDGDVIWATIQESLGARFRNASSDVADKIATRLKEDFERARKLR